MRHAAATAAPQVAREGRRGVRRAVRAGGQGVRQVGHAEGRVALSAPLVALAAAPAAGRGVRLVAPSAVLVEVPWAALEAL